MQFETLAPRLYQLLEGDDERVGFVLSDLSIVEVENICDDKRNGFEVKGQDLLDHLDVAIATWHTHPGESSELSLNDFYGFRDYPDWDHLIVGKEGVTLYRVNEGTVFKAESWHAG